MVYRALSILTRIYKIESPWGRRVATSARPRGGDWLAGDLSYWSQGGIDVVVSLLEADEIAEFELEAEPAGCEALGIEYLAAPIADRGVPESRLWFASLIDALLIRLDEGKTVLAHCRQGIGRASLLAAALLVSRGAPYGEAFERIAEARGRPVPDTELQRQWVAALAASRSR